MHDPAGHAPIVRSFDTSHIRRPMSLNSIPLLITQPKEVPVVTQISPGRHDHTRLLRCLTAERASRNNTFLATPHHPSRLTLDRGAAALSALGCGKKVEIVIAYRSMFRLELGSAFRLELCQIQARALNPRWQLVIISP
jgi:hypothetical protein